MKKNTLTFISTILALVMLLCAAGITESSSEADVAMENPWTEAETAEAAALGAEVGYFVVPEDGMETSAGIVSWAGFEYVENIAQANGGIGAAELTVRKGLKQNAEDVSGDETEYAFTWTLETDGWQVNCFGNKEGHAMKAIWVSDNFSYSIVVRGQGDQYETYGLDDEVISALVTEIQ